MFVAESLTVGRSAGTSAALVSSFNIEDKLPFTSVALHHHFSVVAHAWISEPLGPVAGRAPLVVPLEVRVEDLVRAPSAGDFAGPAPVSLGGHLLDFMRCCGWQPGMLLEDAADTLGFWAARGRILGQSRVSRVLSGYYLHLLQLRFRCRVGLHVRCLPSLQRGDVAFVRTALLRWRWTTFWGGSRELLSGVLLSALLSLRACDARGLGRLVRFLLVCAGYFRHRALLMFLQRFMSAALDFLGMSSDLRGVLLQLRGKIGRRGLARKSKQVVRCGVSRPVEGSPCIVWDYTQVFTITGVLGLNVALVF